MQIAQNTVPIDTSPRSTTPKWVDSLYASRLSVRATNVLLQNCESLEELLSLDRIAIINFKNCGGKTLREIIEFQEKMKATKNAFGTFSDTSLTIKSSEPPPFPIYIEDQLRLPPSKESLAFLPIFSSNKLDNITVNDLHPDFKALSKLSDLSLSARTAKCLSNVEMETIGDVMLTPLNNLLRIKNLGKKSVTELNEIVCSLCLHETRLPDIMDINSEATVIDYTSYENMILTFLQQPGIDNRLQNDRDQKMLINRFCFQEGKLPTLEELGQYYAITRERTRQIFKKATKTLQIKSNIDKLSHFWERLDSIVAQGGGIIHIGELPAALKSDYNWNKAPYYKALGQFLRLRYPDITLKEENDLYMVDCECLACEQPLQQLMALDFDSTESFHVDVIAAILSLHCQNNCSQNHPVKTFYRAFIKHLLKKTEETLVMHGDLVFAYDNWVCKYGEKLEDVICQVLATHGSPMHFTALANAVRQLNIKNSEIADHNVHAAIQRYDKIEIINRGTYGLKSWGMGGYRSVSTAIEELLDTSDRPLRRSEIIQRLGGEFSESNITAALAKETRFTSIGEGFYDRPEKWRQRSCQSFIDEFPDPLAKFASYLVSHNKYSYKLVLALLFIRGMDENGSFYMPTLKERFLNYYRVIKKFFLIAEADTAIISQVGTMQDSFIRNATKEPLKSFLNSTFFMQNGSLIVLQPILVSLLSDLSMRDLFILTMLKAINDYFKQITPPLIQSEITRKPQAIFDPCDKDDPLSSSISIKKKDKGKIKL